MEHYICEGGCGGSSSTPSTCSSEGCTNQGKDMKSCNCTDSKHGGASEMGGDSMESMKETDTSEDSHKEM